MSNMKGQTIYSMLLAVIVVIALILILIPAIFFFDSPSVANQLNVSAFNISNSLKNYIFLPTNNTAYGHSANASGFFAPITVTGFSALAFIFSGFGFIMSAIANLPGIMLFLITTPLSLIGIPINAIEVIVALIIEFILFIITIIGISAWMKYSLREG